MSFENIESILGKPPRWGWNGFGGFLPGAKGYTGEMTLPAQLSQVLRKIVLILIFQNKSFLELIINTKAFGVVTWHGNLEDGHEMTM